MGKVRAGGGGWLVGPLMVGEVDEGVRENDGDVLVEEEGKQDYGGVLVAAVRRM